MAVRLEMLEERTEMLYTSQVPQHHPHDFPFQHMSKALHDCPSLAIPEGSDIYYTKQASDPEVDDRR
jgi:hypothetical protein